VRRAAFPFWKFTTGPIRVGNATNKANVKMTWVSHVTSLIYWGVGKWDGVVPGFRFIFVKLE
jgi:hypothetical protein